MQAGSQKCFLDERRYCQQHSDAQWCDTFVQRLQATLPAVASIVQDSLPLEAPRAVLPRLHRALLSRVRKRQQAVFMRGAIKL